jgi:hypothetical protein
MHLFLDSEGCHLVTALGLVELQKTRRSQQRPAGAVEIAFEEAAKEMTPEAIHLAMGSTKMAQLVGATRGCRQQHQKEHQKEQTCTRRWAIEASAFGS